MIVRGHMIRGGPPYRYLYMPYKVTTARVIPKLESDFFVLELGGWFR